MADINKRLLTSSDGIPAPQHKVKGESDFEFTEGSSGAQHTKIVDSSGQPISIDDELKSIKRTQAEILDRLDNGIDTRLTGSIVDYIHERDVEILAKTTKYIDLTIPHWAEYISVSAGVDSGADSLENESQYTFARAGGRGPTIAYTTAKLPIEYEWTYKRGWQSKKLAVKSPLLRFSVTSANESDITFNLTIATYGNVNKSNRTSISIL